METNIEFSIPQQHPQISSSIGHIIKTSASIMLLRFASPLEELIQTSETNLRVQSAVVETVQLRTVGREELDGIMDEVGERGFTPPPTEVLREARRLFHELKGDDPARGFSVSPGPDGDISLDAQVKKNYVLILCEPDGSALCVIDVRKSTSERRYKSTTDMPDNLIQRAFIQLDESY